jgi:hypothetical protein
VTTSEAIWVFMQQKLSKAPCECPCGWGASERWCPDGDYTQDEWCWPCLARATLDGSWDGN